jgi:hypothetical protein
VIKRVKPRKQRKACEVEEGEENNAEEEGRRRNGRRITQGK